MNIAPYKVTNPLYAYTNTITTKQHLYRHQNIQSSLLGIATSKKALPKVGDPSEVNQRSGTTFNHRDSPFRRCFPPFPALQKEVHRWAKVTEKLQNLRAREGGSAT